MGNFRVFKQSVRFTFRSKRRFIVFLLIFGIVSTFIAFYIDTLDDMRTDGVLDQKGVSMYQEQYNTVTYTQGNQILTEILAFEDDDNIRIETSVIFHYAELDPFIRLYSIDINHPWYSEFIKPSLVVDGEYPEDKNHILVPTGSKQIYNSSSTGVLVDTEVAVGQKFRFERDGLAPIELRVSGKFDSSKIQERGDEDRLWIFADQSKFESLLEMFGKTVENDAYTYGITFVVPGNILSEGTNELVTALNNKITDLLVLENLALHGDWEPQPTSLPTKKAEEEAGQNWVYLLFVVLGGAILTTMFAYLITRFRRREVAILKAMGYAQSSVRTSLIAEILTVAFVGFLFGVSFAQTLLFYYGNYQTTSLLSIEAILVSFAINVLVTLPGMVLVSWRVLQVSPSEAFRDL
ncbi:MAG: ABC transporter permease [Candidatus Kariarchaeaceae archaeon]|jgi:ABC-type antimicrobial peptide transport system permease subunit